MFGSGYCSSSLSLFLSGLQPPNRIRGRNSAQCDIGYILNKRHGFVRKSPETALFVLLTPCPAKTNEIPKVNSGHRGHREHREERPKCRFARTGKGSDSVVPTKECHPRELPCLALNRGRESRLWSQGGDKRSTRAETRGRGQALPRPRQNVPALDCRLFEAGGCGMMTLSDG